LLQALKGSLLFNFVTKSCSHRNTKNIPHHNYCQEDFTASSAWVGLLGFLSSDSEQGGTCSDTNQGGSEDVEYLTRMNGVLVIGADVDTLISVADECLLLAKRDGRDRICTPNSHPDAEARR